MYPVYTYTKYQIWTTPVVCIYPVYTYTKYQI